MDDRWTFPEEPHYDMDFAAIKFVAVHGTERQVCAISTAAINDQFRTEDTPEAAMRNYREHADWVHGVAIKLIEQREPHHKGFYLITSQIAQMFGR
ncbi:DUF1488 family protein [Dyella flagellata]|uniref:DUF1488 domain-containing protein n=1 Tax=Dyella flagellata TaxID=1867833 RepID=A0ABQ5XFI1_9GAMM|nr:DUF1488 family protein [Dyella flagellata]GLQ89406.1 hypothetical protein GCM10007898_29790 [Dyella flagellata]